MYWGSRVQSEWRLDAATYISSSADRSSSEQITPPERKPESQFCDVADASE